MLAQLRNNFPDDVQLVYRHFPLASIHDKALLAAQAADAAGLQQAFWPMHDRIFEGWNNWVETTPSEFTQWLQEQAVDLGLDAAQFATDLNSSELKARAQAAWEDGQQMGLPGTPLVLINGKIYNGRLDYRTLSTIVKMDQLEPRQFSTCPPMTIDFSKQYIATLHTAKGDIVIELYASAAPLAVNNFIFLSQQGWYDNVPFHRVLPGFVAQAGDPSGTGLGGPGYAFDNEISPDLTFDRAGRVGMANAGPDTNGSQFFITFAPTPNLDGSYTIFGQVIEGMDVALSLTPRDPSSDPNPPDGDLILNVSIEEK